MNAQRKSVSTVRRGSLVAACVSQAVGPKRRFPSATAGEAPAATSIPVDRHLFAVVLVSALVALVGCERAPAPPEAGSASPPRREVPALRSVPTLNDCVLNPVIDPDERDAPALRIVSAAPNVTEICCALGLRSALVGRTRYCEYPPEVASVPSIGALIDVNVEALLALKPELILVSGTSRSQLDRFAPLNVRIESVPDDNLDDLFTAIRRIGELTGRPRTAAQLCERIRADLTAVTEAFADVAPARVLLLTATLSDPPRPPYVAGPGSFYDDLLKLAGHRNVLTGDQSAFGPLSLEFIVHAAPDAIIELDPDGKSRPNGDADARAAWSKVGGLRAVVERRVHVLSGPEHYLLGPRIALTYDALCRAIAGEHSE